jgi:hypothetical protein
MIGVCSLVLDLRGGLGEGVDDLEHGDSTEDHQRTVVKGSALSKMLQHCSSGIQVNSSCAGFKASKLLGTMYKSIGLA